MEGYSLLFSIEMRDFEREMKRAREEWEHKRKGMEVRDIEYKWRGDNGKYQGQLLNGRPHGLGKWERNDGNRTVEGEWKDGQLNGKAVVSWGDGSRQEYETKGGHINGKYIGYKGDGRRFEVEFKDGK